MSQSSIEADNVTLEIRAPTTAYVKDGASVEIAAVLGVISGVAGLRRIRIIGATKAAPCADQSRVMPSG